MMDLKALIDKNAWLLALPALLVLWWIDPAHVKTLVQWTLFAFVLMGLTIVLARITLPQINLTQLIGIVLQAGPGADAAARVVHGLLIFVGLLALALVVWAKP